jgi:hypothetical protein
MFPLCSLQQKQDQDCLPHNSLCYPFFYHSDQFLVFSSCIYSQTSVHERFGSEQFSLRTHFPNTKRLGWLLCLELRTRKPSTSWRDKLAVSESAVFVEEWSSGKYPESATRIGESVSCCIAFVHSNSLCLLLCFVFFINYYIGHHGAKERQR